MSILDPTPEQHGLLAEIVTAGPSGLRIDAADASRRMGDLMALALSDLVDVSPNRRVYATPKGKAFRLRVAT